MGREARVINLFIALTRVVESLAEEVDRLTKSAQSSECLVLARRLRAAAEVLGER
jgi:hypothetical protein